MRKQARKGTLSAREQKTLLQQEKRFRKARRPFMKGLGVGAGIGTGALLVPGVAGLISGLGGLRSGKDDPNQDPKDDGRRPDIVGGAETMGPQQDYSLPGSMTTIDEILDSEDPRPENRIEDMVIPDDLEEIEEDEEVLDDDTPELTEEQRARLNRARGDVPQTTLDEIIDPAPPRQPQTRIEDIVLPEMEEIEEDEEVLEDDTPELTRGERAALNARRRAERARQAGIDTALELGLGGIDRAPVVTDDPTQPRERRSLPEVSQGVEVDMTPVGLDAARRAQARAERARQAGIDAALEAGLAGNETSGEISGTLSGRNMLDYLDDYGRTRLPGARVNPRPAQPLPVDRPDPRRGTTLDPRLPGVIDRARRSPLFMKQGGRVDKSNDLVARIKRKYGLR